MDRDPNLILHGFCSNTQKSIDLLLENELQGQALIIFYSAIEALGLLDSESSNVRSTNKTFKNWAEKYLLTDQSLKFSSTDLWGARCGVLHTFMRESDLSREAKAKTLVYFSEKHPHVAAYEAATIDIGKGEIIPVRLEQLVRAFYSGMSIFKADYEIKISQDPTLDDRLGKVLQGCYA